MATSARGTKITDGKFVSCRILASVVSASVAPANLATTRPASGSMTMR